MPNNDLDLYAINVEPDDSYFLKVGNLPMNFQVNVHNFK